MTVHFNSWKLFFYRATSRIECLGVSNAAGMVAPACGVSENIAALLVLQTPAR